MILSKMNCHLKMVMNDNEDGGDDDINRCNDNNAVVCMSAQLKQTNARV